MAPEFWELHEAMTAADATIERLLADAGMPLRGRALTEEQTKRLAAVQEFINEAGRGRISLYRIQEALSTSDFPTLLGMNLDRELLAQYETYPATWQNYCDRGVVDDFNVKTLIALDGLEGSYYPAYPQPEGAEPIVDEGLTETAYTTQVNVYSKKVSVSFRALVNDRLRGLSQIPKKLALGARRTEERFATSLFVDASGPHATLYSNGHRNKVTVACGGTLNNPSLSIAGLQDAFLVLSKQVGADGEPIVVDAVELVVPPALEVTAQNILNALQIVATEAGGTSNQQIWAANWMAKRCRLNVNPYIPIIATTNGHTSWFLFANPKVGRPALRLDFLAGYEQPGLYMKAPNTQRVGGGIETLLGDFDTMETTWKGVHIVGGTRLDYRATVASNGTNAP